MNGNQGTGIRRHGSEIPVPSWFHPGALGYGFVASRRLAPSLSYISSVLPYVLSLATLLLSGMSVVIRLLSSQCCHKTGVLTVLL